VRRALVALLLLGGCSWLHDDYPDRTCRVNTDCFRAQGEVCDQEARVCVAGPDAAPDQDEADGAGDESAAGAAVAAEQATEGTP
jgi:hypothetical protein